MTREGDQEGRSSDLPGQFVLSHLSRVVNGLAVAHETRHDVGIPRQAAEGPRTWPRGLMTILDRVPGLTLNAVYSLWFLGLVGTTGFRVEAAFRPTLGVGQQIRADKDSPALVEGEAVNDHREGPKEKPS